MSTSPEQAPNEAALFRTIREWGITRGDNGVLGGVVEGLGDRIGMARVPARIIVFVLALPLTALVLLGYAAAWGLLPDRKGNIIVQNFGRGVPNVGALIGIAILTLFGLGSFDHGSGVVLRGAPWNGNLPWYDVTSWSGGHVAILIFAVLVPLIIVGAVITAIVLLVKQSNNRPPGGSGAVYAVPPAPSAPATAPATGAATAAGAAPATAPAAGSNSAAAVPPAHQWAPAPPAPPVPPRRPRVPGPGRSFYLLTLAWVAIAVASATWLAREDRLTVHPAIAGFIIFIIGFGVILVLISLAGRKLGFLGFMGFISLIPLLVFAGNADALQAAYAENGGITSPHLYLDEVVNGISVHVEPTRGSPDMFDPTLAFDNLYANVYFDGTCYQGTPGEYGTSSVQRLNLARPKVPTLDGGTAADTSIDITAEVTYLSIPQGTNVVLKGDTNTQATVVFTDRDFQCYFGDSGQNYMELSNPDGPTVNLVVHDDQYANTIVIKEVTS